MANTLFNLEHVIGERRGTDSALSYVAQLSQQGRAKIAQKLGEEAVETVIAAMTGNRDAVIGESADLLFHLIVLLADMGIPLADVLAELERREGVSGLLEKSMRRAR